MRKTLDTLKQYDADVASRARRSDATLRSELVADAAEAFWSYVVQREEFGLFDPQYIGAEYGVPQDVWRAMGPKSKG